MFFIFDIFSDVLSNTSYYILGMFFSLVVFSFALSLVCKENGKKINYTIILLCSAALFDAFLLFLFAACSSVEPLNVFYENINYIYFGSSLSWYKIYFIIELIVFIELFIGDMIAIVYSNIFNAGSDMYNDMRRSINKYLQKVN